MSNGAGEADLITTPERERSSQQSVIKTHWRGRERIHIDPRLYQAASGGDVGLLEQLIGSEGEKHVQPDETAIDVANLASLLLGVAHTGDTALHIDTCFGQYEEGSNVVAELLRKRNQDGETALYQGINHCQVLEVNHCSFGLFSPLHFHVGKAIEALEEENTHAAVVKELLHADLALANCPNNQGISQLASIPNNSSISPLHLAITKNSLSIVTSLVGSLPESASRAGYSGPAGRTALHAAAVRRNEGFIQKVLGWKPELTRSTDNSGSSPLNFAVSENNLEAVKRLLETDKTSAYIADASGLRLISYPCCC
ncbi:hypothetical protein LUZ61_013531 [Rhynchospora tenuis]|uniref:Ankyrin n=1 Tax=Rhynchospora tenuis TaxID=198213 RepID=A0AAD5Z1W1_9POAL|nr:hypothetical protein LUZ61_013531 [Rhynchospora tenuis]